ncbi:MAG: DegT/DnrJ/EryC1/StrS family aminotransferase [Acidobacteriota bacterium]
MTPVQTRVIPFFDYPHLFTAEEEELVAIFCDVGRRGAFIAQQDGERFERNLAAYLGAKHVIGVANATDGLLIALRASGVQHGDEVIFCSHTMVATASAIHFAGATPIPVECGPDHLIDPASVEAAITTRTRAILPTQLNGRTADMHALGAIARRHDLLLVEDAAQALGSRFDDRPAARFGASAAISFFPAKLLGCLGDGGCVVTNDDAIHDRMLQLHDHGRRADGEIISWGLNSRLDNLQAAILDYRLNSYPLAIVRRRALADVYQSRLGDLDEVTLPPAPGSDPLHFDVFQNYEIEADRRDGLREYLTSRGIRTLVPWGGKAVHQWPALGFPQQLPFTDGLFKRLLLLPMNLSLTDDQAQEVCDAIHQFYRR